MGKTSEAIFSLRPVTFHYKGDTTNTPQFGLIAEEVANVNSALILVDKEGKPYSVRYEHINAMLLNEFLKVHRKVEKLEAALEAVNACLKEQDAKIEKVSAQFEVSRTAPQMVATTRK
jgi:trimeric autotransporter adhesin